MSRDDTYTKKLHGSQALSEARVREQRMRDGRSELLAQRLKLDGSDRMQGPLLLPASTATLKPTQDHYAVPYGYLKAEIADLERRLENARNQIQNANQKVNQSMNDYKKARHIFN